MAEKQYYTVVKLAPHVSSWCDINNNIYLSMSKRPYRRIEEGCDMTMINKGVKAGLIIVEVRCEEDKPNTPGIPVVPEHPVLPEDPTESPKDNCDCLPELEDAAPIYCKKSKKTKKVDEVKVEVNIVEDNKDKEE